MIALVNKTVWRGEVQEESVSGNAVGAGRLTEVDMCMYCIIKNE